MQEIIKQQETTIRKPNRWPKGVSGNPNGRPSNPEKRQLQNALRQASRNHNNKEFLYHVADLAYTDKQVTIAVLDKLVADQTLPKEQDDSNGFKQLVIIRADREEATDISRRVHIQPEAISRDVEFLGNGKDNVINISGNVIQRASQR